MPSSLAELAEQYERESHSPWISARRSRQLRHTAALMRRMVCNREAADPTRLTITWSMLVDIPARWCRQHGYRTVTGHGGYVIQRGSEQPVVTKPGDTLIWDGNEITVRNEKNAARLL
ncbi:hypothetical protein [Streptomyces qinglanensis]|uniref:Uncharacterized protein n=1 Tax=Streptomyces qinglanensis TaxID=943816 RepID=A0A1H9U356_9ACTN|nr:hypothetical protein [Streptomyces qinglanensis]SES03604.1 hypothetical protein SAMN05421870_107252 [Streptomyces qinglanensis]